MGSKLSRQSSGGEEKERKGKEEDRKKVGDGPGQRRQVRGEGAVAGTHPPLPKQNKPSVDEMAAMGDGLPKTEEIYMMEREQLMELWGDVNAVLSASADINAAGDIYDTDWQNVEEVRFSDDGSSGVCFVKRETGSRIVLKGVENPFVEVIPSQLALLANVSVPATRVLPYTAPEYKRLVSACQKSLLSREDRSRFYKLFRHGAIIVMEYVDGLDFWEARIKGKIQVLLDPTNEEGKARLREMGRIIALDCVLNNFDRLPLIWTNQVSLSPHQCVPVLGETH